MNFEILSALEYMNLEFPPSHPVILYQQKEEDYYVQGWLRYFALFNQSIPHISGGGPCPYCGEGLLSKVFPTSVGVNRPTDLHHALISRKDVQGSHWAWMIHHSYNVLLVHKGDCHTNITREQSLQVLSSIFGFEEIEKWYESLPFQVVKERKLIVAPFTWSVD